MKPNPLLEWTRFGMGLSLRNYVAHHPSRAPQLKH